MSAVLVPLEMYHAVETCKRCAATLIAMRVKFLFGEDVSAGLDKTIVSRAHFITKICWWCFTARRGERVNIPRKRRIP